MVVAMPAKPDEVRTQVLRMQRAVVQRHPKQWQAGRQQVPGEFVQGARAPRQHRQGLHRLRDLH